MSRNFYVGQLVRFSIDKIPFTGVVTAVFTDTKYPIRVRVGENLADYLDQVCPYFTDIEE